MARYFTADLHVEHHRIIELCDRPFTDAAHMLAVLEANWRRTVGVADDVYLLGDISMGDTISGLARLSALPGNKFLVPGNHDKCFPGRRDHLEWVPRYEAAGITVLDTEISLEIAGVDVTVCHFPPAGDSRGHRDRYAQWRPVDGGWVVHGHVHERWLARGQWINVGVDVWDFTPVHEDTLAELIAGGLAATAHPGTVTGDTTQPSER